MHLEFNELISDNKIILFFFDEKLNILQKTVRIFFCLYTLPVLLLLVSFKDNYLFLEGSKVGFLEDYLFLSFSFLISPLLLILLNLIIQRFKTFANSIPLFSKNNNENHISLYIKDIIRKFSSKNKIVNIISIVLGIIVLSTNTSSILKRTTGWNSSYHSVEFIITLIWLVSVLGVITVQIFIKYLLLIISQIKITKFLVQEDLLEIKPLSPDKAGGLRSLGNLSLSYSYFLAPLLFVIVAHMLTWSQITIGIVLGVSGYIPLIVFVFFYPLGIVHNAMVTSKMQMLNKISFKFDEISKEIMSSAKINEEFLLQKKQIIELLDNLYNKASSMPNWPFDTITLTKFGSILGAIITSIWLNWLFGKLVQL